MLYFLTSVVNVGLFKPRSPAQNLVDRIRGLVQSKFGTHALFSLFSLTFVTILKNEGTEVRTEINQSQATLKKRHIESTSWKQVEI